MFVGLQYTRISSPKYTTHVSQASHGAQNALKLCVILQKKPTKTPQKQWRHALLLSSFSGATTPVFNTSTTG